MGREHALLLAARGAAVVVNDLGSAASGEGASAGPAESVAEQIRAAGGRATPDTNDISTEEGGRALVATAFQAFGRLDIVVNNAGIFEIVPFVELPAAQFDRMMKVNAYGPFNVLHAAWPHLLEQGYGRIVNVSSAAGLYGYSGRAHYAASKAALLGLSRTLAAEGADEDIRVNILLPSALTRMTSDATREAMASTIEMPTDEEGLQTLMRRSAAQVAAVVAWLCHERCDWNGELIHGGRGKVARAFTGITRGYEHGETLSPEDVEAASAAIFDESGYTVPSAWTPQAVVHGSTT
jgi:NAD(P)-dependent dehydrogenase (short-subunit alcohol dehydrogenase family)